MSRSTFGGGWGGGGGFRSGDRQQRDTGMHSQQREKKRSEELFGTLMGQDAHGGRGDDDGRGGRGGAEGKEAGKNEVDLGFLHR